MTRFMTVVLFSLFTLLALYNEAPAQKLAPVKSIELLLSGPKTEVSALKKKINQQAFQALLGEVVR